MDGWFKALIGAACIVIIASGGYYLWSEYPASLVRTHDRTANIQAARAEAERYSGRVSCAQYMTPELGEAKRKRDQCRQDGFISYAEQLDAEAGKTFRP